MRMSTKFIQAVKFLLYLLCYCVVATAQTSTNSPGAGSQSATAQASGSHTGAADPNATGFPHDRTAPPSSIPAPETETAPLWNGYETHFAVEFGGRALSTTGNADVYATFVNLQPGVRLVDESLEMHSVNHNGWFFDDLMESSFGVGGDPNEAIHLRASKHHWYDFDGSWRRDINFWDYNLLGNPLNPPTSTPFIPINVSPKLLDLSRRMLDFDLRLFPDSAVQFVLGYSHYDNGGPSLTAVHVGTEAPLFQEWRDIGDSYRFGISWRPVERTRVTFDEFYRHQKSDTNDFLNSFPYLLPNGTPVNLGLTFNTAGRTPCATPFAGPFANPTCNLFTGYSNVAPYSTDIPTEQLSFQMNPFERLHVSGRASYTWAQTNVSRTQELFEGLETRTGSRESLETGSGFSIQQITTSADAGITYDITEKLSLEDQFRWYYYRIPSSSSLLQTYSFGATALSPVNAFSPATCLPPYTGPGCPFHSFGSPADASTNVYSTFQAQNQKRNSIELHDDFSTKFTGYIGYKFERQDFQLNFNQTTLSSYYPILAIRGGCTPPFSPGGICQTFAYSPSTTPLQINTQGGVGGFAAQPFAGLRLNADVEIDYADNVFTNIMPRHRQLYRARAVYKPRRWVNVSANARIEEMRDLAYGLGNLQHNRSFSFATAVTPSPRWGVDVNYTYEDLFTNLNVCFVQTPAPAFATITPLCGASYLTAASFYHNYDNFGSANLMLRPITRTTLTLGYAITSTTGANLLLNPYAPLGPTETNYHLPSAALAVDLAKHLALKAGWNLYDYKEKSPPGPVAPRNFRANLITIALRYAM